MNRVLASCLLASLLLPLATGCDTSPNDAEGPPSNSVIGTWAGSESGSDSFVWFITSDAITMYSQVPPESCWRIGGLPYLRLDPDGRHLFSGASNLQLYVTRIGDDRIEWEWVSGFSGTADPSNAREADLTPLC